MFLLDTDYAVLLQCGDSEELRCLLERMSAYPDGDFYYPVIAFHEQMLGANAYISRAKSPRDVVRGYAMLHQILADFSAAQVLTFDEAAARTFEELRKQRVRVGTMDLRIASIALSRDITVLTRNLVDFQQVPGLRVEDWTTAARRMTNDE